MRAMNHKMKGNEMKKMMGKKGNPKKQRRKKKGK